MFQLRDKADGSIKTVFKVRESDVGRRIEFLIYSKEYGFVWNDSSYFEPK